MRREITPSSIHSVSCDGAHASIIEHPENPTHYLAAICRRVFFVGYDVPRIEHEVSIAHLDDCFEIVDLKTISVPSLIQGTECGIMNVVLLSPTSFVAYILGYKEEAAYNYCLCEFVPGKITKVTLLDDLNSYNPVVLKHMNGNLIAIHSYDPLRILSINMNEGSNQVIHMQKIFEGDGCVIVGGSAVYSPKEKKYILSLCVEQDNKYVYSFWALLTERYKLCGLSNPFLFNKRNKYPEYCSSLMLRNNHLYAAVSINYEMCVYEYPEELIVRNTAWP